jgi:hypothetical protein
MAHFAKIENGLVTQVIVAEQDFINTLANPSSWIQTSYNTCGNQHPENRPLRGNYAGVGYVYDKVNDVFYTPQPYPSWVLNQSTWLWEAPMPYPQDNKNYQWDETTTSWVELV